VRNPTITKQKNFMTNNQLAFIGTIHSELKQLSDCPRQENEKAPGATIEILNEFVEGIQNIKPCDEIIFFTSLHKADRAVLKTRPRNDNNLPLTGVFSTRSPDRPNPIGIHIVRIASFVTGKLLKVSNLEVLDGTPIIDIKPHF
jgi:tRNA-Thr(GGU) m(6)t(6)A37 methyltransferase TsaA